LNVDIDQKIKNKTACIAVIGLGYVGLPTAVNFAENGFSVIGVNRTQSKVDLINAGGCYLSDLNLDERVKRLVERGKLTATTDTVDATRKSDVIIITVPTPITSYKRPDLSFVTSAGRAIAHGLGHNKLVVLESTVYPGVVDDVLKPILEESGLKAGIDFGLAYCPERYNPGDAGHSIRDVVRIVAGITPEWAATTAQLYVSNADLTAADLSSSTLCDANLAGASMERATLYGANLTGADLSHVTLERATVERAQLNRANLAHANLGSSNLKGAILVDADLHGADVRFAVLIGADLTGADLRGANLAHADLTYAVLAGVKLEGAMF
jgi:hypothetical protein